MRHLQTLVVQVAIVGYIIHVSSTVHSPHAWSRCYKYGERVWVLRCAGSSPMGKSYRALEYSSVSLEESQYYLDTILSPSRGDPWDTESIPLDGSPNAAGCQRIAYGADR